MGLFDLDFESLVKLVLPKALEKMPKVEAFIAKYLSEIELLEGEERATIMLVVGKDNKIYLSTATIDFDSNIKRVIVTKSSAEFLKEALSKLNS